MRRADIIRDLIALKDELAGYGVDGLYLYGSVARDEARQGSDVDLLVDAPQESFSIFRLAAVKRRIAQALNADVDVHDFGGYRRLPAFRARVGPDIVRVF
jgi:hypothetical protein